MAWSIVPSSEETALLMEAGVIYRDSRRCAQAREVFQGVRALFPNAEAPEVALGTVALAEGDADLAVAHYRRALELNPRSAFAWAHLAQATVFKRDRAAALQYCRKALEMDPRGESGKFARSVMEYAEAVEYRQA